MKFHSNLLNFLRFSFLFFAHKLIFFPLLRKLNLSKWYVFSISSFICSTFSLNVADKIRFVSFYDANVEESEWGALINYVTFIDGSGLL